MREKLLWEETFALRKVIKLYQAIKQAKVLHILSLKPIYVLVISFLGNISFG